MLKVRRDTVRAWIHTGELEAFSVSLLATGNPRWRISPASLDAVIELRKAKRHAPVLRSRRRRQPTAVLADGDIDYVATFSSSGG